MSEPEPVWIPTYETLRAGGSEHGRHLVIWQEDDARAPDSEGADEAWARIFGELRTKAAVERFDGGDAFYYLYSQNRVLCSSYPGASAIYQWMPARRFE
jgi:hypothetical protein